MSSLPDQLLRDSSQSLHLQPQVNDGESEFSKTPATVRTVRPQGLGLPKPESEMTADERARADEIDLRCLSLCIGMLERVNGVRPKAVQCLNRPHLYDIVDF